MKIKKDRNAASSWMGFCLTITLLLTIFLFLYPKIYAWQNRTDIDLMGADIEGAFDFNYKFDATQGLFVAAALTEYNSNTEIIEEPEKYGELVLGHYGWGNDDEIASSANNVDFHYCSDEELGFERTDNTLLYPIKES